MNAADRRRLGLVIGWAGTTAAAVALALAAVGAVSDSVTENRPGPLSAAAVSAALAEGTATTAPAGGPASTSPTTQHPPATTPSTRHATPSTTRPSGTSSSSTTGPSESSSSTSSTAPGPSTSVTTGPGGASPPEERTYELVGGTARVRFADGQAELLAATPKVGFRVERESGDPGEVRVVFRGDGHESRLRAWWDGGPREEIEERDR